MDTTDQQKRARLEKISAQLQGLEVGLKLLQMPSVVENPDKAYQARVRDARRQTEQEIRALRRERTVLHAELKIRN